jgi:hypothetical protein
MKRIVRLWDHDGIGLIIKCETGVIYSNQTGGACCMQPEQEGAFVPVGTHVDSATGLLISTENDLLEYFQGPPWFGSGASTGLTNDDADAIDRILLPQSRISQIIVDRGKLRESHEAWVHVLLGEFHQTIATVLDLDGSLKETNLEKYSGFGPCPVRAILTWGNSD